ncbi:MAG: hypothetical protein MHM6MM_002196 [Cercozoa sp. M6MM]
MQARVLRRVCQQAAQTRQLAMTNDAMVGVGKKFRSNKLDVTLTARSLEHSNLLVAAQYRSWMRHLDFIMSAYEIEGYSKQDLRRVIRAKFDKFRGIHNLDAVDMLRHKGDAELHEAVTLLKTESHVYKLLDQWRAVQIKEEERVLPTMSGDITHTDVASEFLKDFMVGKAR